MRTPDTDRFLSTREIAARLSVSEITVRRLIASGALRAVHPTPRLVRVRESDVQELLSGRTVNDRREPGHAVDELARGNPAAAHKQEEGD